MKKAILKTILGSIMVLTLHAAAQAQVSLNVNLGSQPAWGPTGYNRVENYYLPDIESYYDVNSNKFTYLDNNRWITSSDLPPRYSSYDLYSGYKVVVNRPKPYLNFSRDRVTYVKYKNWKGPKQALLREKRNNGNHFGNDKGDKNHPGNNGNHFGNDKDKGHDDREYDDNERGHGNDNGRGNGGNKGHGHHDN